MKFYVDKRTKTYGGEPRDISPRVPNSFTLKYDAWDDYSLKCRFILHYTKPTGESIPIGELRIVNAQSAQKLASEGKDETINWLDDSFTSLPDDFYSLGKNRNYYREIKKLFGESYEEILKALRDCAITPNLYEKATKKVTSLVGRLTRDKETQDVILEAQTTLKDVDFNKAHKFTYIYSPPYGDGVGSVDAPFNFDTLDEIRNSKLSFNNTICAIIGKNGAGKSKLLQKLAKDICEEEKTHFKYHIPIFQKIIYISSSFLDTEPDIAHSTPNYVYSGIPRDKEINLREFIRNKIKEEYILIENSDRESELISILDSFLHSSIIKKIVLFEPILKRDIIDVNKLIDCLSFLSSGECMLVMHLFTIMSQIFTGSLILMDEPENHLHPNAISSLINIIEDISEKYYSCVIIATHSPIIIHSLRSRNVLTIGREDDLCYIRNLEFETLGNNLSTITDKIFHNDTIPPTYKEKIKRIKNGGIPKEQLISSLCRRPEELSLALLLFIESIYREEQQ